MTENLTSAQKPNSSDELDSETESEMSTEDEISQPLTPKEPFQNEFNRRLTEMDFEKCNKTKKKHSSTPRLLKELRMAYDKTDCTELTHFYGKESKTTKMQREIQSYW